MEMITEWERKGWQEGIREGREEGERVIIEQILVSNFGPLPDSVEKQLKGLKIAQLESLAMALSRFNSIGEVEEWLSETI